MGRLIKSDILVDSQIRKFCIAAAICWGRHKRRQSHSRTLVATPAPVVQLGMPMPRPQRLDYCAANAFGTTGREVKLVVNEMQPDVCASTVKTVWSSARRTQQAR